MPNTAIWRNLKAHKIHNLIKNKTGHWPNKYGKHDIMYEIFSNSHKSQEKKKKLTQSGKSGIKECQKWVDEIAEKTTETHDGKVRLASHLKPQINTAIVCSLLINMPTTTQHKIHNYSESNENAWVQQKRCQ